MINENGKKSNKKRKEKINQELRERQTRAAERVVPPKLSSEIHPLSNSELSVRRKKQPLRSNRIKTVSFSDLLQKLYQEEIFRSEILQL
ncbi:hypothetical protein AVEN_59061-1 [Araneus ventricosus]|uniref:Uncharacterized protein n=1 Tax=Araneus ventricosus TaxID=182803 RepID=A0A4Y2P1E4_ARAVE|nr:hypothetical protein AVEN_59061-1 [Araneus ventricosus]